MPRRATKRLAAVRAVCGSTGAAMAVLPSSTELTMVRMVARSMFICMVSIRRFMVLIGSRPVTGSVPAALLLLAKIAKKNIQGT